MHVLKCFKLLLLMGAAFVTASAQTDNDTSKRAKPVYTNISSIGVMLGQNNPHVTVQTINGVQLGQWFGGIGVGLDYYFMRTLPVFVDVRRMIIPKKNLYLYADGGLNYPLINNNDEDTWLKSSYKKGWYYDAGAGYLFTLKKRTGFFSIGYSSKKLTETVEYPYIWGPTDMPVRKDELKYRFNRISVKAGIRL